MSGRAGDDRWPDSRLLRAARAWLSLLAGLVPEPRREYWLEEWEGELWELWRRAGRAPRRYGGRPGAVLRYSIGAPVSALWELKEEWMTELWRDVRYGVRTLARAPGFLVVAVITLALGIGANTTVFSLVNGLLFRDPPGIVAADRLVRIGRGHAEEGRFDNWSLPVFRDFREQTDWYSGVAGYANAGSLVIGRGIDARAVPAQAVSHDFFDVLGVRPALGREFVPEETAAMGAASVAVISHALWQSRFAGDPDVVGATLAVNGRDLEVIGVAPAGFAGADIFTAPPDLWIPVSMMATAWGPYAERLWDSRGSSFFWVFARLAPGVTVEQARAATGALYARLDEQFPDLTGQGVRVVGGVGMTPDEREEAGTISRLLQGIVLLVLLIACANLAGLALARGAGRRGEVGVRTALGASRIRVVRQLLTESLLVAAAGGAVAVGITYMAARWLPSVLPYSVSIGFEPDGRVFLFALGTAVAAGVIFGLLPALRAARTDVRSVLAGDPRSIARKGTRLRRGLVALQLALSFVLLAGTGLLLQSLYNARVVDPGFEPDGAAVVALNAAMRSGYDEEAGRSFFRRLRDEARALPGVDAVGMVATLPLVQRPSNHTPVPFGEAYQRDPDAPPPPPVFFATADDGYFEAAGIEIVAGRGFGPGDRGENAERVAVINETLARRFFGPGENPIGQLLPFGARPDPEDPTRVIGVAGDHRNLSLDQEPVAHYWVPWDRSYAGAMVLVARTAGDGGALATDLGELVERIDPGMPILQAGTLRSLVGGTLGETRTVSILIAIFGLVALVLAAVGLYGVMAYSVARRTREMGVRIALGARARDVVGLVLRQGLVIIAIGLGLGLLAALAGLRLLEGLLYDVAPGHPPALILGAVVLAATAAAAALVPAWKATRVEPVTALKEE